ncbi:MAG: SIMPL domain-containing protein [Clostridiales bacterium]|jgi:uncharacterized protein YggE|nr:SIMPL domain-containing protein [Clostridiales bacterium]
MKNKIVKGIIALSAVLALTAVSGRFGLKPQEVMASELTSARKITVSGQGTVKVKPDVAYITLGVQTDAKVANDAQKKNTEIMNNVIAAVKAMNIAEKDIMTSGYSIYPQYDYTSNTPVITGHSVMNNITVTVRNIDTVGDVIDKAIEAGANTTNSIQFNVSDPSPYYAQALKTALADAKAKGLTIAESLGVKIGQPIEVIEQSNAYSSPVYGNINAKAMAADTAAGTPIQSGELEISAILQVVYSY